MNAADFRRIALSFEGAEEGSHMGAVDFRVGGRIFATLASQGEGYGNLMLTPEQQADFVGELPDVFLPVRGGWGGMGATHIRLAGASEDFCTLCKTPLKADFRWPKEEEMSAKAIKLAVFNEWDEHLRIAHPRQWEREQRKRARRRAGAEPYKFPKDGGIEGQ